MFYFEVPSDNKLVDLVKQIKKGEMDIYLGLFLFSYQSISLFFILFLLVYQVTAGRVSANNSAGMSQLFTTKQASLELVLQFQRGSKMSNTWRLRTWGLFVIYRSSRLQSELGYFSLQRAIFIIPLKRSEYAVPDQTSAN